MWNSLTVGAIGLAGVLIGQWMTASREKRKWQRESLRDLQFESFAELYGAYDTLGPLLFATRSQRQAGKNPYESEEWAKTLRDQIALTRKASGKSEMLLPEEHLIAANQCIQMFADYYIATLSDDFSNCPEDQVLADAAIDLRHRLRKSLALPVNKSLFQSVRSLGR